MALFGSSSPFGTSTPSLSGKTSPSPNPLASATPSSPFWANQNTSFSGAKPFGSPTFGSQTGTPLFGETATAIFGATQTPSLGSMTPAFGASATPAFGSTPLFGQVWLLYYHGPYFCGQTPATPFCGFGWTPAQANSFGSTPFGQTQPVFGLPSFGSTASAFGSSTPAFGSTPFGSTTSAFGASSTPVFGASTTPSLGASGTPAFGASSAPAFGASSTPAFGASTTPLLGASGTPAFGASSAAFGASSTPSLGASETPASGASSTPASGTASATLYGSRTPTSGQSASAFGSSTLPAFGNSSVFGSGSGASLFGASTMPAFGSSPSFGTSTFASLFGNPQCCGGRAAPYSATNDAEAGFSGQNGKVMSISAMPAYKNRSPEELRWEADSFGCTASVFGSSMPAFGATSFGSTTPAFGASSTPAFGASTTPLFGASGTGASSAPVFGVSSTPASATSVFGVPSAPTSRTPVFGASSTPAFGTASTIFGSTTPAFGQSVSAFGSSTTPAFGSIFACGSGSGASPCGASTTPAFGSSPILGSSTFASLFSGNQQRRGSRTAPYFATNDAEAGVCGQIGKQMSISAMPAYKNRAPEELRWEDYQAGDKGGCRLWVQQPAAAGLFGRTPFGNTSSALSPTSTPNQSGASTPSIFESKPRELSGTPSFGPPFSSLAAPLGIPASSPVFGVGMLSPFGTGSTPALNSSFGGALPLFMATPAFPIPALSGFICGTPAAFGVNPFQQPQGTCPLFQGSNQPYFNT